MCDQARIYPDTKIYDPFCGSGTILIEAALMASRTAPGLRGFFAAEKFSFIPKSVWETERNEAYKKVDMNVEFHGYGYDISPECVALSRENAKKAGVEKLLTFEVADVRDFGGFEGRGLVVTNPPYGERLLDIKEAEELYKVMGKKFVREKGKKYFEYLSLIFIAIVLYKLIDMLPADISGLKVLVNIATPLIAGFIITFLLHLPAQKIENLLKKAKGFFAKRARGKRSKQLSYIAIECILREDRNGTARDCLLSGNTLASPPPF
jgi:hypothetical protein